MLTLKYITFIFLFSIYRLQYFPIWKAPKTILQQPAIQIGATEKPFLCQYVTFSMWSIIEHGQYLKCVPKILTLSRSWTIFSPLLNLNSIRRNLGSKKCINSGMKNMPFCILRFYVLIIIEGLKTKQLDHVSNKIRIIYLVVFWIACGYNTSFSGEFSG